MSFLIIVAAVSLLTFLTWIWFFASGEINGLTRGSLDSTHLPLIMMILADCIIAGCCLGMFFGGSRGKRVEIVALSAIALSTVFFFATFLSDPQGKGMDRFVIGVLLVYFLINTGCPLACLGALTFLRRTRWARNR